MLKYRQLYQDLRKGIEEGSYQMDEPLPSIRSLAAQMQLSKTTVEAAYQQLLLEGYVYGVQGVGYFVNVIEVKKAERQAQKRLEQVYESQNKKDALKIDYDFANEYVDASLFKQALWHRSVKQALKEAPITFLRPSNQQGEPQLRAAISRYMAHARGVEVSAQEVIIGAGIEVLLSQLLCLEVLGKYGLAIEDPGFKKVSRVFQHQGFPIHPVEIDDEGLLLKGVSDQTKHLIYVSPAHQFPTGGVMKRPRRLDLLAYAKTHDCYIIEDDFNAELRYDLFPVPALKSMDNTDRVIYLGSFSTYMMPGLRLSYMILPKNLKKAFDQMTFSQTASQLDQLAFTHFLESGAYQSHLRNNRNYFKKKSEKLHALVQDQLKDFVRVMPNVSGFYLMLPLVQAVDESYVMRCMRQGGIQVLGLSDFTFQAHTTPTLILNYRGMDDLTMENGVKALLACFKKMS